ncbi:MAG: hypothetical protein ACR2ME_07430 [Acidimicrobiia bacterium]
MHRVASILVALAVAACGSEAGVTTSVVVSTSVDPSSTTSTAAPLVECPPLEYQVTELPTRVTGEASDLGDIELDEFTAIGGTRSVFWVTSDGTLAIALIRGTLPPADWPGERGQVDVAGTDAVVGPFDDGKWVAAWFEGDGSDRCDLYTMVFYPPVEDFEVELTLRGITKTQT